MKRSGATGRKLGIAIAAAHLPCATASACAQTIGMGKSLDVPVLRIVLGFVICAILAFGAAILLRRYYASGRASLLNNLRKKDVRLSAHDGSRRIVVLESRRISPHADVCRFAASGQEYLVLVSSNASLLLRQTELPSSPSGGREDSP